MEHGVALGGAQRLGRAAAPERIVASAGMVASVPEAAENRVVVRVRMQHPCPKSVFSLPPDQCAVAKVAEFRSRKAPIQLSQLPPACGVRTPAPGPQVQELPQEKVQAPTLAPLE